MQKLSYPYTDLDRPLGLQDVQVPMISRQSAHESGKVVSPTHRPPWPPGDIPGTHFCLRLSRPQGHSAAGRIKAIKTSNDPVGNRTGDLPACSAVPRQTAPLRTPKECRYVVWNQADDYRFLFWLWPKMSIIPTNSSFYQTTIVCRFPWLSHRTCGQSVSGLH
jgi:hypothetical protein